MDKNILVANTNNFHNILDGLFSGVNSLAAQRSVAITNWETFKTLLKKYIEESEAEKKELLEKISKLEKKESS